MKEEVLVCFRSACTNPADARCYNNVTHGFYCRTCAYAIDKYSVDKPLFPYKDIKQVNGHGRYVPGTILVKR